MLYVEELERFIIEELLPTYIRVHGVTGNNSQYSSLVKKLRRIQEVNNPVPALLRPIKK